MATAYDYYKDAAERHLETCKELREYIKANFQGKPTLSPQEERKQKMILANIYYLSGYVIECIVNYGILKHIKFENMGKELKNLVSDDNPHGVSYSNYPKMQSLKPIKYVIYAPNHRLNAGNKHLFFKSIVKITGREFDAIPFINGKPLNPKQQNLFKIWGATIRYEIDYNLLVLSDIEEFCENSEKIYNGMDRHIIPFLSKL